MNHTILLMLAFAVGLLLLVGGGIVMANGEAVQVTRITYTGEWGALPALLGLIILVVSFIAAWDEGR